jgi:SHS2 domain-containing protein
MEEAGYENLPHTADVAIRAWAPDLRGLIEQAARGMIEMMYEPLPEPGQFIQIIGEGDGAEDLLIDCLREILLLPELSGLIPVSVAVQNLGERRAVCLVGVVAQPHEGVQIQQQIKAVTYHGLEIARTARGLQVEVVFDV